MKVQVLANHYDEDDRTVGRFLSSLAMQEGVEFGVLLFGDGGRRLDGGFLGGFGLDMTYRYLPHAGVCATRNALLDASDAEYVLFADVDDCFTDGDGLLSLVAVADDAGADVVGSPFLVEGGGCSYSVARRDTIHVHGKLFRRQFLVDNAIRFPGELETSGDMMFLWLAFALAGKVAWVRRCSYAWKFNPKSVTRGTPYSMVEQYPRTLRCYELLDAELERRGLEALRGKLAACIVPMMYLDCTGAGWAEAPYGARRAAERAVADNLGIYAQRWRELPAEARRAGYDAERGCKPSCGSPFDGIGAWVDGMLARGQKRDVLVIGHGVVGGNLERELSALNPDVYDKYKGEDGRNVAGYRIAFVCVDTPRTDVPCDISEVRNAILENDADLFVVKSTVLPGTTERLAEETGRRVVFSPEYYGATQHCNRGFDFTILGGERADCVEVAQLLQRVYDGRHSFRMVDARTAELAKYMENCWLATKVSFCNQFAEIAESEGVDYEELRELFVLDPRVNPSHTFVYRERPYWESHCLDKDVRAISDTYDAPLVDAVVSYNDRCKGGAGC